jgi:hypothetical protein
MHAMATSTVPPTVALASHAFSNHRWTPVFGLSLSCMLSPAFLPEIALLDKYQGKSADFMRQKAAKKDVQNPTAITFGYHL